MLTHFLISEFTVSNNIFFKKNLVLIVLIFDSESHNVGQVGLRHASSDCFLFFLVIILYMVLQQICASGAGNALWRADSPTTGASNNSKLPCGC